MVDYGGVSDLHLGTDATGRNETMTALCRDYVRSQGV